MYWLGRLVLLTQFEIAVNFFVGFYSDGIYVDSLPAIARLYTSSPFRFWFDLSTSIPFGWIDYAVYLVGHSACLPRFTADETLDLVSGVRSGTAEWQLQWERTKWYKVTAVGEASSYSQAFTDSSNVQVYRVGSRSLLPLFIVLVFCKFGEMQRFLYTCALTNRQMEDIFSYFSGEIAYKMIKLFSYASCTVHAFSCAYWRVKMESSDAEAIAAFLNGHNISDAEVQEKLKITIMPLIVHFPCCSSLQSLGDIYVSRNPAWWFLWRAWMRLYHFILDSGFSFTFCWRAIYVFLRTPLSLLSVHCAGVVLLLRFYYFYDCGIRCITFENSCMIYLDAESKMLKLLFSEYLLTMTLSGDIYAVNTGERVCWWNFICVIWKKLIVIHLQSCPRFSVCSYSWLGSLCLAHLSPKRILSFLRYLEKVSILQAILSATLPSWSTISESCRDLSL